MLHDNSVVELRKESNKDPMEDISFDMKIEIDEKVFEKIMYWIDKADFEVSGLGKIVVDREKNIIRVVDAVLIKQEGSSAATELDAASVGKAMFLLKDSPGDLRWWWHSHVNMGVFWSGTDQGTIKQLGSNGWFTATVFNKKREFLSAFVQSSPVRVVIADVATRVDKSIYVNEAWDKEYAENVTEKTCTQYSFPSTDTGTHESMEDIIAEFHKRWPEENEVTHSTVGFTKETAEPDESTALAEELIGEMSDEDYKAYSESHDVITARFERGELSDDQYDNAIKCLNEKYGFDTDPDDDDENVLTDEEAAAMDLGNSPSRYRGDD
jgi:hypothetical protein